jgi:hypothetical protein
VGGLAGEGGVPAGPWWPAGILVAGRRDGSGSGQLGQLRSSGGSRRVGAGWPAATASWCDGSGRRRNGDPPGCGHVTGSGWRAEEERGPARSGSQARGPEEEERTRKEEIRKERKEVKEGKRKEKGRERKKEEKGKRKKKIREEKKGK